jgi:Nucleotide modification associated domain 2
MQVDQKLSIADYYRNPRFARKIPSFSGGPHVLEVGDNIYEPLRQHPRAPSGFRQLWNKSHWDDATACAPKPSKAHDISGQFVLVATRFAYFGRDALAIPPEIRPNVPRGQSSQGYATDDPIRVNAFIDYVFRKARGRQVLAAPDAWPEGDDSWQQDH